MKNKKSFKKGIAALFASCLLVGNVAPALAATGGEWLEWLLKYGPAVYEICKTISDSVEGGGGGGADRISCWSRAKNTTDEFYVDCASCTRQFGEAKGIGITCTRQVQ